MKRKTALTTIQPMDNRPYAAPNSAAFSTTPAHSRRPRTCVSFAALRSTQDDSMGRLARLITRVHSLPPSTQARNEHRHALLVVPIERTEVTFEIALFDNRGRAHVERHCRRENPMAQRHRWRC